MNRRWRPSLGFVLGGALAGTLAMSFAGLIALRYLGPEIGFRNAAYLLGAAIIALTAGLGWLLVRLLLRPIAALERYASDQVAGGLSGPVPPPAHFGTRELHRTARSVMDMAETLRDREATIRSYTDHVTHELKSPVAAIRAAVELIEDGGTLAPGDRKLLGEIDGARAQIEDRLAALRAAARAREARYLGQIALSDLVPALRQDHPDLVLKPIGGEGMLPMSADGLRVVLGQLLRNAAESGAGEVSLRLERDRDCMALTVADDGHGISPGNAARIFEPFFTTRRDSGGTGMGLSIVRNILAAHRAEIALLPAPSGAAFRLTFQAPA
jgi:signal transduction histidine kinase